MLILKIGEKELNIKYGYEATLKTRLLSRMAKQEGTTSGNDGSLENIEDLLLFLPEFLLVGLQKYHKDEYGFEYETGNGKEEQIEKMFGLIDEYCDAEEQDAITLYNQLQREMLKDGFLKSMFRKEKEKAERKAKSARTLEDAPEETEEN